MGAMEAEQADGDVQRAAADAPEKPLLPIDLDTDRVTYTAVCSLLTKPSKLTLLRSLTDQFLQECFFTWFGCYVLFKHAAMHRGVPF